MWLHKSIKELWPNQAKVWKLLGVKSSRSFSKYTLQLNEESLNSVYQKQKEVFVANNLVLVTIGLFCYEMVY